MNQTPSHRSNLNPFLTLTLVVGLSVLSSCGEYRPAPDGLEAWVIEPAVPGNPTYEVSIGETKVALVTFDWVSRLPGIGRVHWYSDEDGSFVTIMLTDPDGADVHVTLTEADGKITASGAVDRVKIEMLSSLELDAAEVDEPKPAIDAASRTE